MAKKRTTSGKKMRVVFETREGGLARQVAKAIKAIARKKKRRPGSRAGGWSQSGGWILDKGPSGPWGLMSGWSQGKDLKRRRPGRNTKRDPIRRKNVRRALKRASARRR